VTRTQTKALVVVPGALAGMHTDSEHYSSSDDGSVDLEIEGNRCGNSSDSESQSAQDTVDVDDSSDDEAPPAARKASLGGRGRTGSTRGGRGKAPAAKKSKGELRSQCVPRSESLGSRTMSVLWQSVLTLFYMLCGIMKRLEQG
jgi:hypothetical protein